MSKSRRIDPPGLITGTAGLFFLVYGLIEGNARGWSDPLIVGAFVLSAVVLAVFFWVESHRESPMLPLSFFRIPTFATSNVVAAAIFFGMFGSVFFLSLYLQNVLGYSPEAAGVRLLAFSAVILFVAPISGRLSDRFGPRWFMIIGPLLAAAGIGLLLRTEVHSAYGTVLLPSFLVLATGMAMTMSPMTAAVMSSVETRHAGVASAATNTSREIGGVFGIALLGAIITSAFKRDFFAGLVARHFPAPVAHTIVDQAGAQAGAGRITVAAVRAHAPQLSLAQAQAVVDSVRGGFVHAIHVGIIVAVVIIASAGILSAIFIKPGRVETPEGVSTGG